MDCCTLDSRCFSVLRNPHDTPYLVALRAFCAVAKIYYFFVSPFFLLSTNIFFADFFRAVQVSRTDDLHLLQFFNRYVLNEHILIFLLLFILKSSITRQAKPRGIKETLHIESVLAHI